MIMGLGTHVMWKQLLTITLYSIASEAWKTLAVETPYCVYACGIVVTIVEVTIALINICSEANIAIDNLKT